MKGKEERMNPRWSLMDLVALSVIGISCGALFAGWNLLWGAVTPLFALVLPLQYLLLAGTWVIAGPLAGVIIKRRGAALFGELIAASVSFLLASQWSIDALFSGAAQGLGAEAVFLLFGYRVWSLPVLLAAGAVSGVGMALHDLPLYFAGVDASYATVLAAAMILSSALLGGGGAFMMHRALRRSGALDAIGA
jgi:energy-coupling factor transport system substrate-specific component